MEKEDRFWFWLWSILATLATIIILTFTICMYLSDIKMAELGYEKVSIIGHDYPVWQKGEK